MRIAICDDSINDTTNLLSVLKGYIERQSKDWIVTTYLNGNDFLKDVMSNDLVLLDIEMPGMNGIETGRLAKKKNPELKIIMFTGSEGYGEDIFDIGAVDYIGKPINPERVIKSIMRVESVLVGDDIIAANKDWMPFELYQKDVRYIRAYNGYTLLYCRNNEYRVDRSLIEIEKELDNRIFLRIDKSMIVNLLHVDDMINATFLVGKEELKISRRRFNEVKKSWIEFDLKNGMRKNNL